MSRAQMPEKQWSVIMRAVSVLEAHGYAPASGPVADLAQEIVEAVEEEIAKHISKMEDSEWSEAGARATFAYQCAAETIRRGFEE